MLVEDDNNLREIYEARLAAEGFDIVSAQDGEAALALAAKEHPDLVITDIMMPKISGFEMLDILRNTEALRDVKVIMLTALGQAEDNARAGALGADRYLVKSQVTLEDIVKATHDVLGSGNEPAQVNSAAGAVPADTAELAVPQDGQPWKVEDTPAPDAQPVDQNVVDLDLANGAITSAAVANPPSEPSEPVTTDASVSDPQVSNGGTISLPPVSDDSAQDAQAIETATEQLDLPQTPSIPAAPETSGEQTAEVPSFDASAGFSSQVTDTLAEGQEPVSSDQPDASTGSDTATAEPAAEEESQMRAQIDQFLNDSPTPAAAQADDTPADDSSATDLDITTDDSQTTDASDNGQIIMASPPPDENESEYAKDAGTPDMGQLEVREEPAAQAAAEQTQAPAATDTPEAPVAVDQPAAVAAEPAAQPTPGYPSQAYDLPTVPGAAVGDADPQGDGVISNAINDMISSTAPDQQPQTSQPADAGTQITASGPAALPDQPDAEQDASQPSTPGTAPAIDQPSAPANEFQGGGSMRSHIVSPLNLDPKPDLNQLLSMEEAKAAAQAAGASVPPQQAQPASQPVWQPGQPWVPPTSNQYIPPTDPNSISL